MPATVVFAICLVAVFGMAAADDAEMQTAIDDRAFFGELPVVLSVTRLAQPLADAPGAVTVIDAEAIRTSGARDLADLLRTVPGFLVAQTTTGAPVAVYHGMTDENPRGLQILVDGRSQYSPLFFGGVSWNLIDVALADIERIEVIRGSNSAAYGSNAFLGVVNVITRTAAEAQGAAVGLSQGSDGVADRQARIGTQWGTAFVRLSAERQNDDGVEGSNDTRQNQRANLRADLPIGASGQLQIQAGAVNLKLDAGAPDTPRFPPHGIKATKDYLTTAWTHDTGDGGGIALRFSRSRERYRDVFVATDPGLDALAASLGLPSPFEVLIDQHIRTTRNELEFQHTLIPAADTRLVWGAGERNDNVLAPQFYGTGSTLKQGVQRIFSHLEWRPAPWVLNIGATWEHDSLSKTSFAPRLSTSYHLTPTQTLRGGVSRAHRIPTLTESRARTAYGAFDTALLGLPLGVLPVEITRRASGHLAPERIDTQEIGYLGDLRALRVFVDVRIFRERVHDRITPVVLMLTPPDCELLGLRLGGCGEATDFINGQDLDIRGLEYQIRWRPRATRELTLNQTLIAIDAQAHAGFVARDSAAAAAADRHMANSAPKVATMMRWRERLPLGIEASIVHYRYGQFQWTGDSSVGPFYRTDVRLAAPLRIGNTQAEVAAVIQGVGGRRAEYRARATATSAATPEYLSARSWISLSAAF